MSNHLWNLKKIRELKEVTPTELGKWCGFDEKTAYVRIADYEKFKRNPNDDQVRTFSKVLNVLPEVLYSFPRDDTRELCAWRLIEMSEQQIVEIQEDGIKFIEPMFKDFFKEWKEMDDAYKQGKITEDEYYKWKIKRRL